MQDSGHGCVALQPASQPALATSCAPPAQLVLAAIVAVEVVQVRGHVALLRHAVCWRRQPDGGHACCCNGVCLLHQLAIPALVVGLPVEALQGQLRSAAHQPAGRHTQPACSGGSLLSSAVWQSAALQTCQGLRATTGRGCSQVDWEAQAKGTAHPCCAGSGTGQDAAGAAGKQHRHQATATVAAQATHLKQDLIA